MCALERGSCDWWVTTTAEKKTTQAKTDGSPQRSKSISSTLSIEPTRREKLILRQTFGRSVWFALVWFGFVPAHTFPFTFAPQNIHSVCAVQCVCWRLCLASRRDSKQSRIQRTQRKCFSWVRKCENRCCERFVILVTVVDKRRCFDIVCAENQRNSGKFDDFFHLLWTTEERCWWSKYPLRVVAVKLVQTVQTPPENTIHGPDKLSFLDFGRVSWVSSADSRYWNFNDMNLKKL